VHLLHRDARHLGPCLVRIRVVVEEFVAEHECHCEQTVLAAGLSLDCRVGLLESVDEKQCQENYVLSHLGSRQDGCYPFPESGGRVCIGDKGLNRLAR
jgi:hypothetical protein